MKVIHGAAYYSPADYPLTAEEVENAVELFTQKYFKFLLGMMVVGAVWWMYANFTPHTYTLEEMRAYVVHAIWKHISAGTSGYRCAYSKGRRNHSCKDTCKLLCCVTGYPRTERCGSRFPRAAGRTGRG